MKGGRKMKKTIFEKFKRYSLSELFKATKEEGDPRKVNPEKLPKRFLRMRRKKPI